MANLNLTPQEVVALYDMLYESCMHKKAEYLCDEDNGCCSCGKMTEFHRVDPIELVFEKIKNLIIYGVENISTKDTKAQLDEWLHHQEKRVAELKKAQAEVNGAMRDMKVKYSPKAEVKAEAKREIVDAQFEEKVVAKKDESVFDDEGIHYNAKELTRELNEDKEFKYPKPNAPRPVMPGQGRYRGKHKK